MSKEQQTELIQKFIREFHSKQQHKKEEHPVVETNRPTSNHTSSNNQSSDVNSKLQEQLRRRQQAIQKLYRRSVVNKIYIFPRDEQRVEDLLSVSSHRSIEEMQEVTTYRLYQQAKKIEKDYDKLLEEYRSQPQPATKSSASKQQLRIKECMHKMKRRVESSGKLLSDVESKASKDSARVLGFATNMSINNTSGLSIKKEQKKPITIQQLSARQQQLSIPLSAKQPKSKKQTYQELLQRLDKSKDSHKPERTDSNKLKPKLQDSGSKGKQQQQQLKRQPFSNVSVSKILDKYNQVKVKSGKRDDRCRTEY